jgi:hypothetical protein
MEEQHHTDDQSHYEISLTAGQAFIAFVLLLLSLAASFAFGLMLGKGQADERLVVRRETPVVTEAALAPAKKSEGKIVELPPDEEEAESEETAPAPVIDTATTAVIEEAAVTATTEIAATPITDSVAEAPPARVPYYAQLLSTSDQKTAEGLAARVIEKGFSSAYVERGATEKGPVFRVRVKFPTEADARAAESKLREFSKEVWITAK